MECLLGDHHPAAARAQHVCAAPFVLLHAPPRLLQVVEFDPLQVAIKFTTRLNKDIVAAGFADVVDVLARTFKAHTPISLEFDVGRLVVSPDHSMVFHFDASTRDKSLKVRPAGPVVATAAPAAHPPFLSPFSAQDFPIPRSTLALYNSMHPPHGAAPAAARPPSTARTDVSRLSGHIPASRPPVVPPLPLAAGAGSASGSYPALPSASSDSHTKRSAVLDAAYKRHLDAVKKVQAAETHAQELYDKEVTDFDRTLYEKQHKMHLSKVEQLQKLQAQLKERERLHAEGLLCVPPVRC